MTKAVQGREERDEQWQSATTKRNLDQLDAFVCQQLQLGQVGLEYILNILNEYHIYIQDHQDLFYNHIVHY